MACDMNRCDICNQSLGGKVGDMGRADLIAHYEALVCELKEQVRFADMNADLAGGMLAWAKGDFIAMRERVDSLEQIVAELAAAQKGER